MLLGPELLLPFLGSLAFFVLPRFVVPVPFEHCRPVSCQFPGEMPLYGQWRILCIYARLRGPSWVMWVVFLLLLLSQDPKDGD